MDDKTLMVEEAGERTQMVGSVECPVCQEQNVAGTVWCAECGFRLDSAPGEAADVGPAFALSGEGQRFPLKSGENVVGRLNADVFLSDVSVSRRHAVVRVAEDGVFVRDEGSSNGTRMNNVRMAPGSESPLLPGEPIQFGAVKLTLEAPEGAPLAVPPAPDLDMALPDTETAPPAEPEAALAVLTNGVDTWPLRAGLNTIGRREENDVTLADPAVSGRHATITIEGGEARIADTGSTNGTFVTEQRLVAGIEQALEPGSMVRFGRVVLNYEVLPAAPEVPEGEDAPSEPESDAGEAAA